MKEKVFNFDNKYRIRVFDKLNWCVEKKEQVREKYLNRSKKPTVASKWHLRGYYQTLEGAKKGLVEIVAKNVGDFEELDSWINKIKEV